MNSALIYSDEFRMAGKGLRNRAYWCAFSLSALLLLSTLAWSADPISVSEVVAWREVHSANSIGNRPGDFLKIGALRVTPNPFNGNNGSTGTSVRAFPPGSLPESAGFNLAFKFSPASPNEFSGSNFFFSEARTAPWTITVTNVESLNSPVTVYTPAVLRADGTIPGAQKFVQDMSISGVGTNVTFHFTAPADSQHDAIGLRIFDRNRLTPAGFPIGIHVGGAPANATEITPPAILNGSGDMLQLGGQYVVSIQLQESRADTRTPLSRSVAYFNFSPLGPSAPPRTFLPMVGPDNVYHFTVNVQAGQRIFIDPEVAVGYEYATGDGDPNFESIMLPNAGDNLFYLHVFNGSEWVYWGVISAGVPYSFGGNGVSKFRVSGIEPTAGLNPKDPTAFVSGLTFVADGQFTGTMTPLTSIADSTPPIITPTITGTMGNGGWYTGPVTVAWNVADGESGISSPPCPTTTLDSDTSGTTLTCTATSTGGTSSNAVTIKIDRTPPILACSATPNVLWPPDNKMVNIAASVNVSDSLSGPSQYTLVTIASNEPNSGQGSNDVQGWGFGTAYVSGQLRATRSGSGAGRIYTLVYRGTDVAGNAATCSTTVTVPHDQGKQATSLHLKRAARRGSSLDGIGPARS